MMHKSRQQEQIGALRRLGLTLLAFSAVLTALSFGENLDSETLSYCLSVIDPMSCLMMGIVFAVMGLFALGGAWQKKLFHS